MNSSDGARKSLFLACAAVAISTAFAATAAAEMTSAETITVIGSRTYRATDTSSSTKTNTPLVDVPQSVTVITEVEIRDRAVQNLADTVRYVPGVSFAQGEGNRDTPIFRGNASTADMFVDGVRDDVQYFRDLYNVERVDVLRGSNGMIFGRGGGGGIINRITRQANGQDVRGFTAQLSGEGGGRVTGDFGMRIDDMASFRVTGVYEDSEGYRDDAFYERNGLNPTFALQIAPSTELRVGYEYYDYEFVADRGVSSFAGRPLDIDLSTFFGDPARSPTTATVNALNVRFEHEFGGGVRLVNHTRWGIYDKYYQNIFAGATSGGGANVAIEAYNNATDRDSLFNQTDLTFDVATGSLQHTILAGIEVGRQITDNFRETGFFTDVSPTATSIIVPVSNPRYTGPVAFSQGATDADNHGTATQYSVYLQDQIEFSPRWQAVVGVRFDRFEAELRNNRNGAEFNAEDNLWSPRVGLIYKPVENASIYASYSQTFVPRAGEQLASLNATNSALDPEEWENIELGAKWDVSPTLSLTAAVYQLRRTNIAITDPLNPAQLILVEGQEVRGVELGVSGEITDAWHVVGGYAYQDSEILSNQSATVRAGATLAQTPEHSFSLWNRYDFTPSIGAGLGVIYVGERFATVQNLVTPANNVVLEDYTRVDGAVYWTVSDNLRVQLNVENLLDEEYFVNAHSATNIMPGSPRAFRVGLSAAF
ncbi:TonB-dependent receptor [Terricaulis silvestris]|uniref:Virulence-associated outer membrane protein Vir-90 n=1 Tax=Terricaulis silvestris TaxID=2686094 RepID=A0A6I6MR11_9CAUL|nr:TonB-dependent siderophore receptor [Terricaulis silvestris]QGZ97069.1 Virulence-associated outer membrane protein Vir-90 [Terricaulis silvestris]